MRPQVERLDLFWAVGAAGQDGEVQVLGEAVGLDVALLQAGTALEDPLVAEDRGAAESPQQPAEDVVLLDDLLGELPLADPLDDVRPGDHHSPPGDPRATLTRSPQRRTMRPGAFVDGSSITRPELRRSKQAWISSGASTPECSSRYPSRLNTA